MHKLINGLCSAKASVRGAADILEEIAMADGNRGCVLICAANASDKALVAGTSFGGDQ